MSFSLPTDEYDDSPPKKPVPSDNVILAWVIILVVVLTAVTILIIA